MDAFSGTRHAERRTALGPPRADVNLAIKEILARQGDVIGHLQLGELGLSRAAIRYRLRRHELFTVFYGVYSGTPGPLSQRGRDWATLLSGGPEAALSALTGAAVLDLTARRPRDGNHVLVMDDGRRSPARVTRHRTRWLPEHDIVIVDGLRCTSPARTLLDCASLVDSDRLDGMLDRSVGLNLYDGAALERVMRERRGVHGTKQLQDAIARLDENAGRTRSVFERKTLAIIRESRLIGMPTANAMVADFESDLWFFPSRAMVECDGRDVHKTPAQRARDELREQAYLALGYVILRLRWHQVVYEPARTLERIERFVLANQEPPVPGVTGRVVF